MYRVFILYLFLSAALATSAQEELRQQADSGRIMGEGDTLFLRSSFVAALKFSSDQVYLGRSDSVSIPYLTASGTYLHRSGLFARSAASYLLVAGESRIDLISLAAGYNYFGRRFSSGGFISGSFYSDQSYNVQAEMSAFVGGYFEYDLNFLVVSTDLGIGFSDETDLIVGLDLSKEIYAFESKLLVEPFAGMNAGTQHYYYDYITNRSQQTGSGHEASHGHNAQTSPVTGSSAITLNSGEVSLFNILDYEAGLQLTYKMHRFKIFMLSTVYFPVTPVEMKTATETITEELSIKHVLSLGIRYRW